MVKSISIQQIHTDSLSCEPLLERTKNGELLCVCQCGDIIEPAPGNRVYAFHSKDNGLTWSKPASIYPEDGQAVYATELTVFGDEITAYISVHSGRFLDWKCFMMKSFDNGYTWKNYGTPPFFPEYTFMRAAYTTSTGRLLMPYQTYPLTREEHDRVLNGHFECMSTCIYPEKKPIWLTKTNCESGVLLSDDNGATFSKHLACTMYDAEHWIWSEPTIAELSDGTIAMLLRRTPGVLYRCDSKDFGETWSEPYPTDIPNPANKPRLFNLDGGRIALIHTPNKTERFPLQLWISEDDMKSWEKTTITDFPGSYSYTDGFYENGHIHFVVEHNRHSILYCDVTVD